MNLSRVVFFSMLLVGPGLAAETLYVTDKLRLGVHLTRDTSGKAFALLKSGDRVEVLERDGSLTLVKMEDERSGWVRGSFLQPEEPALRRIQGVEAERDRLAAELEALRSKDGAKERARLQAAAREAAKKAEAADAEVARLQAENSSLQGKLDSLSDGVPRSWLLVGIAASLVLGFMGAWRWFDYRSRKRHGGFRVY
ncbi:MAG: TIGR04211 family SH3 domain-containing protein [Chromatiales bacterium]|nr:MAG: TIGR04211 family SH3 domain-containing protein [Chromatiales bacterium]